MFTRKKKASIAKTLVSKRVREVGPALLLRCSATSDIIELVTTETPEAQSERRPIFARMENCSSSSACSVPEPDAEALHEAADGVKGWKTALAAASKSTPAGSLGGVGDRWDNLW